MEKQVQEQFNSVQFSEEFVEKVVKRVKTLYESKKTWIIRQINQLQKRKQAIMTKLEVAEEKLIAGILPDEAFTRIKTKNRQQIADIDEEIYKLERTRNIKVDVIQQVLALARNIGQAYATAPPELKRLYLGLFWERFDVA